MNNYLIPANAKKSMLIFGLFTKFDLFLFGGGIGLTLLLLILLPLEEMTFITIRRNDIRNNCIVPSFNCRIFSYACTKLL